MFDTPRFMLDFSQIFDQHWGTSKLGLYSCRFDYDRGNVGWSETDSLDNYPPEALEEFMLGRRCRGLRVKTSRTDLPAPQTHKFVLVYGIRVEYGAPMAIIHHVYVGPRIGKLTGD